MLRLDRCHRGLVPRTPSIIATIDFKCGSHVGDGIKELPRCRNANSWQPAFVPSVIDLEESVAAFIRDAYDLGVQSALPTSDPDGSFFELVRPHVTDDLNDLCLGVGRVRSWHRIGDADGVFGFKHG